MPEGVKPIRVCTAGATGWAAPALARGIAQTSDRSLAAVSKVSSFTGLPRGLDRVLDA